MSDTEKTDSDPGPLTFATTPELLDELSSRFDDVVFIAMADRTDEMDELEIYWRGTPMSCAGMGHYVANFVFEDLNDRRRESD